MNKLPICQLVPELLEKLSRHNTILLQAPPGSGKSTELPAAIFESGLIRGKILMLQPRRMAARALAKRLAWRLHTPLGGLVGFSVRHQQEVSAQTQIEVLTEGLLTRRLLSDPFLENTGLVILDEFHERSAESDLALAALKEAQELSDLKILVMSATLDQTVADYLPGTAIVTMDYAPYPLEIRYLPQDRNLPLEKQVYAGLKNLLNDPADDGGDILAFLPGQKEIERTAAFLRSTLKSDIVVERLYGALPAKEQDRVLNEDELPAGRRLILSTNIAQTSLTVPRVRAVIDLGLQKRAFFDPYSAFDRLTLGKCSQAAATQRSGRAARLGPGRAVRLWSQQLQLTMAPFDTPEIMTDNPDRHLIWMQAMQPGWYQHFPFITTPANVNLWQDTLQKLIDLQIIEKDGRHLTALGQKVSSYPLPPRLALLVELGRKEGCHALACTIAALLAGRDIADETCRENLAGDLESRLDLLQNWEEAGAALGKSTAFALDRGALTEFVENRRQLLALSGAGPKTAYSGPQLKKLLLGSFLDQLAAQSPSNAHDYTMSGGRGLHLETAADSQCPPFLLVLSAREGERGNHSRAILDLYQPLTMEDLKKECPLEQQSGAYWDAEQQAVIACTVSKIGPLEISRHRGGKAEAAQISQTLLAATRNYPLAAYAPEEKIGQLELRLKLAQKLLPGLELPPFDQLLERALQAACDQAASFKALAEQNWPELILGQLDFPVRNAIKQEVPTNFTLPRGQQVKINYEQTAGGEIVATAAAHIQEFYGLKQHPAICRGHLPLKLSLLAPNNRPAQITSDIVRFWQESYPAVRKELFGRYPKHSWPEDPQNAECCGLGRKRKS